MTDVLEQPDEEATVERGVVDDQDPSGIHADAPSPDGDAISDAWRASGAIGFAM
jgi:hypothetical protein